MFFSQAALQKSLEYACGQQSASQHLISRNRRQSSATISGLMSGGGPHSSGALSSLRHQRRQLDGADSIDSCSLDATCAVGAENSYQAADYVPVQMGPQAQLAKNSGSVSSSGSDNNNSSANIYSLATCTSRQQQQQATNRSGSRSYYGHTNSVRGPQQISVLKSATNNYELQYEHLTDCSAATNNSSKAAATQRKQINRQTSNMEGGGERGDSKKNGTGQQQRGDSKNCETNAFADNGNNPPDNSWRQVPLYQDKPNELNPLNPAAGFADTSNNNANLPARFKSRDLSYADDGIR